MPSRQRPANPNNAKTSMGNRPTRKTGNSGNSSRASDCLRIAERSTQSMAYLEFSPRLRVESRSKERIGRWISDRRHPGADFGAQFVDQAQALVGLDMPEGPAVAGAGTLRHRADAVDRADFVAEHDGAVGADQGAVALFGVDQFGAGRDYAALDQFGERHARRVARGHERRQGRFRQRLDGGDARFCRSRVGVIAFEADIAAAETFGDG